MSAATKAISLVLLCALLVAVMHGIRMAKKVGEMDQTMVTAQKIKRFLKPGSNINVVEEVYFNEFSMRSRGIFFPTLLFRENERILDTVLLIKSLKGGRITGEPDTLSARKVLYRHQDDSNFYVLLIR